MPLVRLSLFLLVLTIGQVQSLHANNTTESTLRLLVLGDSLTAGYGLQPADSFPAQLEEALHDAGYDVRVINAGVSGDTSAGGLSRLDWALSDKPHVVLLELGGNDALRGLPPAGAEQAQGQVTYAQALELRQAWRQSPAVKKPGNHHRYREFHYL